ncbi:Carbonic anhydrase or acetyltransferase, isoleucine patch superfamily [Tindallia magadiensis]|uniref:Carbonic anhydrase or acetyltransferase, isoleucine patch superfamily n=1 Tax=Tindallia magadiensis TaxID=69895 RepID=A0A1I3A9L3_9FIRM|nr:gamma carbonic anhydrase family protein [Tindallia magadiensis]SFH46774.1 Carbonic anhydrase or acetyltransferase, isoleucine patch superfamily [Tindallia magadiensis]
MLKDCNGRKPECHNSCFIAETASVIGKVVMKENASLWYGVIARGDYNDIYIGEGTNIQDGSVIHIAFNHPTVIGDYVTVGHNAVIHGCHIGDEALIGMGAIILNGATIGSKSIIAAGSLVPEGKEIPPGVLAMGSPAKVVRNLTEDEKQNIRLSAEDYIGFAKEHKKEI